MTRKRSMACCSAAWSCDHDGDGLAMPVNHGCEVRSVGAARSCRVLAPDPLKRWDWVVVDQGVPSALSSCSVRTPME